MAENTVQSPWAANRTQPIPRTTAENTAPTIGRGKHPTGSARRDTAHRKIPCTAPRDRPREIHCHSAATPAGRAQTAPHRGRARHSPRNRENSGVERARILDPGPALMRWDACRGWQAFPRASDACDRDGSLLLLKSIAHPKGTRQVESVSADGVGRYAPPQRPAAQCSLPISAPSHGRPVKPHPIQLCSSCFSRPAPLVLRLFPIAPKGPRACLPPRRENCLPPTPGRIGAPESAKKRDASLPFAERRGSAGRSRTRMRAAHEQECGPLTNENLEGEGSDGDLPLGVILWESKNTKRIGTGDSLLDNAKGYATLLDLQAVFAARPFPLGTASPPGLPHRTRLHPRSSSTVSGKHHDAGAVWQRALSYGRNPARGSTPPLPMQRSATPSPTRRRSAPAPGLKTTTAFRPSPPANALRLRRPVAVLRRRQSAAQLYAVVDLYTAIWFVTRMRRLTGADSAQHDLLTISRTWISASVSSEQWGHVSQWRRRRAAASRGI